MPLANEQGPFKGRSGRTRYVGSVRDVSATSSSPAVGSTDPDEEPPPISEVVEYRPAGRRAKRKPESAPVVQPVPAPTPAPQGPAFGRGRRG